MSNAKLVWIGRRCAGFTSRRFGTAGSGRRTENGMCVRVLPSIELSVATRSSCLGSTAWLKRRSSTASGSSPSCPAEGDERTSLGRGVVKSKRYGLPSVAPSSARVVAGTSTVTRVAPGRRPLAGTNWIAFVPTHCQRPCRSGCSLTGGGASSPATDSSRSGRLNTIDSSAPSRVSPLGAANATRNGPLPPCAPGPSPIASVDRGTTAGIRAPWMQAVNARSTRPSAGRNRKREARRRARRDAMRSPSQQRTCRRHKPAGSPGSGRPA